MRSHVFIGDIDECFVEISREDTEFHIESAHPWHHSTSISQPTTSATSRGPSWR